MKKPLKKKEGKKESFLNHRTSWKWFERKYRVHRDIIDQMNTPESWQMLVLLEILKELQYLNDRR